MHAPPVGQVLSPSHRHPCVCVLGMRGHACLGQAALARNPSHLLGIQRTCQESIALARNRSHRHPVCVLGMRGHACLGQAALASI